MFLIQPVFLQSELERERIALELEEEKKAQAQREKVLQEQAKKIENLSSMVLLSNRDEKREQEHFKKVLSLFFYSFFLVIPLEFKQDLLGVIHLFGNISLQGKRRDTWCTGHLSRDSTSEVKLCKWPTKT